MTQDILVAICLVMVIEGILPFVAPKAWREAMLTAIRMDDKSLRMMGLVSMITGAVLLYVVR